MEGGVGRGGEGAQLSKGRKKGEGRRMEREDVETSVA